MANAFEMMSSGSGGEGGGNEELISTLVTSLMESAEHPPSEVQGVSDEFIEGLERVPKQKLKQEDSCPICANPFLDGECHTSVEIRRGDDCD